MPGTELFGTAEKKEINDVLETGLLFRYNHEAQRNGIWKAREFEAEVKKITGAKHAHAVSSGSAAVSCALAAAGVGAGDEVIVPPFTYIAPVEAVLLCGAIPIFAEIDETLCLSAKGINAALTPKTKAILLVHMCGGMARMDEIVALCKNKKLTLVEDAGQAFGASFDGTAVGLFGKTGSYSFDFFKIATAGEGGIVVTNDFNCYKHADSYSDHGHSHIGDNRGMEDHEIIGFNYRISELHAAVGLAQTRKVPYILEKNRAHKQFITDALSQIPGVTFTELPDPKGDSATFLNVLLPTATAAQKAVEKLTENGIGGFNYWYTNQYHFINQWEHLKTLNAAAPLSIHSLHHPQDYKTLHLPKSQEVIGRLISFGIRVTWTQDDLALFVKQVSACLSNAYA